MPYVDGKDVAQKVMLIVQPIIAERDRLAEEVKKLKEANRNLNMVILRGGNGIGYKS